MTWEVYIEWRGQKGNQPERTRHRSERGSKEKELFWIRNTRKRFRDGYNYFGWHPEKTIGFLDKHMK